MSKGQEVGGGVPDNVFGTLADIVAKVEKGSITEKELKLFAKRQNPFPKSSEILLQWEKFFNQVFGLEVNLLDVKIPRKRRGFDRIIVVPQGLTLNQVIQACKDRFQVYCYWNDLDKSITVDDCTPVDGSYAIRIRDRVEADEELKNLSAKQLEERDIKGTTLLERLILEIKHYQETEEHLDIKNVTLCSGSRGSGGDVPSVGWSAGWLYVGWYSPDYAYSYLRARAVVS